MTLTAASSAACAGPAPRMLALAAGLAFAVGLVFRAASGWGDTLWFDEAWTLAIVNGSPAEVARQIYWDVNAPLYYLVTAAWTEVFGASNGSLRFPSLLASVATPLLVWRFARARMPDEARLACAALLALWIPALTTAGEARCYALLVLLATAQTLAFIRWLDEDDRSAALVWAALGAAAALTHYHAWLLVAAQGVIQLVRLRPRRVLALWPAFTPLVPAFAWTLFHLPRLADYAQPEIAWYAPLDGAGLLQALSHVAGSGPSLLLLLAVLVAAVALGLARRGAEAQGDQARLWLPVLAAVAAAAVLVGIGFLRPSFTYRYLAPFVPGLLLGAVLLIRRSAGERSSVLLTGLVLSFTVLAVAAGAPQARPEDRLFSFESASRFLGGSEARRLVFLADQPAAPILRDQQLTALATAFLRRDGRSAEVELLRPAPGEDVNPRLAREAARPDTAVLWLYELGRGRPAPDLAAHAPGLDCRRSDWGRVGVIACA